MTAEQKDHDISGQGNSEINGFSLPKEIGQYCNDDVRITGFPGEVHLIEGITGLTGEEGETRHLEARELARVISYYRQSSECTISQTILIRDNENNLTDAILILENVKYKNTPKRNHRRSKRR